MIVLEGFEVSFWSFEILYSYLKFVRIRKIDISVEYVYDHHTYDTIVES